MRRLKNQLVLKSQCGRFGYQFTKNGWIVVDRLEEHWAEVPVKTILNWIRLNYALMPYTWQNSSIFWVVATLEKELKASVRPMTRHITIQAMAARIKAHKAASRVAVGVPQR